MTDAPPPPSMPAGWYPDHTGTQRYWDGTSWTEHTAGAAQRQEYGQGVVPRLTSDETSMGALAHGLAIPFAFIGPLIILLAKGDSSTFVKHHAIEALNFSITVFLAAFASAILIIVLIGLILLPLLAIGALVLHVVAALAASRGEWYRYPFTLRLISGPV